MESSSCRRTSDKEAILPTYKEATGGDSVNRDQPDVRSQLSTARSFGVIHAVPLILVTKLGVLFSARLALAQLEDHACTVPLLSKARREMRLDEAQDRWLCAARFNNQSGRLWNTRPTFGMNGRNRSIALLQRTSTRPWPSDQCNQEVMPKQNGLSCCTASGRRSKPSLTTSRHF